MFGINKHIIEEHPEDHVNPFDKAKELNKTGFEKFMDGRPEFDDIEETKKFIEYNYGLTVEKIIQDVESRVYSKGTKGVQRIYTSRISLKRFIDYVNSLNESPINIEIDSMYPLHVSFDLKSKYQNNFNESMAEIEMTVDAGAISTLSSQTNKRYK